MRLLDAALVFGASLPACASVIRTQEESLAGRVSFHLHRNDVCSAPGSIHRAKFASHFLSRLLIGWVIEHVGEGSAQFERRKSLEGKDLRDSKVRQSSRDRRLIVGQWDDDHG